MVGSRDARTCFLIAMSHELGACKLAPQDNDAREALIKSFSKIILEFSFRARKENPQIASYLRIFLGVAMNKNSYDF